MEVFVKDLIKAGKILPALEKQETEFVKSLSEEQFAKYEGIKQSSPAIVKFDDEKTETKKGEKENDRSNSEPTPEVKADEFLSETK